MSKPKLISQKTKQNVVNKDLPQFFEQRQLLEEPLEPHPLMKVEVEKSESNIKIGNNESDYQDCFE